MRSCFCLSFTGVNRICRIIQDYTGNWSRLFAVKRFCKSFCRRNGLRLFSAWAFYRKRRYFAVKRFCKSFCRRNGLRLFSAWAFYRKRRYNNFKWLSPNLTGTAQKSRRVQDYTGFECVSPTVQGKRTEGMSSVQTEFLEETYSDPLSVFYGIFSAYMPYHASGYLSVYVCVRLRQKKQTRISIVCTV